MALHIPDRLSSLNLNQSSYVPPIVPLVYNDNIDSAVVQNILFIDNTVQEYQQFVDGCNVNTFPIVYDYHSDRNELKELLNRKFSNIQRIAFVFHNACMTDKLFLNNQCFFEETPFSENVQFLMDIIRDFHVGHVDYLACNSLEYDNWRKYYELLTSTANVVVGASNDATGNLKYGGDWIMETTGEDIKTMYFNEKIDEYTKTLATSTISTSTTVTNANLNNMYTWPITINGGSLSSRVVITFGDDITLNNTNQYFIIGSDYVTVDGGNKMVTISGVTSYPGLIQNGRWNNNGFSNITVQNINIQTTNNSTLSNDGGWICQSIFCRASSGTNIITNCANTGVVSGQQGGGIVGVYFANASSGTNIITNCTNSGNITKNWCGGIAGCFFASYSSGTNIITNCTNSGNIIAGFIGAGGITGDYFAYHSTGTNTISNCTNSGQVSGNGSGGITSYTFAIYSTGTNAIINCANTGNVIPTINNNNTRAGGIISNAYNDSYGNIRNCYTLYGSISYNISPLTISNTYEANGAWSTETSLQYLLTQVDNLYIWAYPKVNGVDQLNSPFLLYSLNPSNTRVGYVAPTPTILTFSVPSPKTYGDAPFTIQNLSSNSLADFSYNSTNTAVATISGGIITIVGVGNTNIIVKQDASGNYTDGSNSAQLVVNPPIQVLRLSANIIKNINNSVLTYANSMPMKDSTSDGTSTFSIGRIMHVNNVSQNSHPRKKWIGGNRDSSQITKQRSIAAIGNGAMNSSNVQNSFVSNSSKNVVNDALRRVRGSL